MRLRRRLKLAVGVLASSVAFGCGSDEPDARDQWLVTVATDAPIPTFGDRVLVEVLDSTGAPACSTCQRLFDASSSDRFPISFGIRASDRALLLRARLYRSPNVGPDGLPAGTALIDALGPLPPASGVTNVMLELPAACFDVPANPLARKTCDPATRSLVPAPRLGAPKGAPAAGSWPPAARVPCPGPIPDGMVCVPGGVYLLGSFTAVRLGEYSDAPERVVRLDPFAIDIREHTVGAVEALIQSGAVSSAPLPHGSIYEFCTYLGLDEHANDAFPVNCVGFQTAADVCAAQGKRLPTEAEWEYAASNAGEDVFPWGSDDDVCTRAYVGRSSAQEGFSLACHDAVSAKVVGPVVGGSAGDVSALGIENMAGNVAEWVVDDFAGYDADCWSYATFPLANPKCVLPEGLAPEKSLRGGFWSASPFYAHATVRNHFPSDLPAVPAGIRCVKSWSP